MKSALENLGRVRALSLAIALLVAASVPLTAHRAYASSYGQVTTRSIKMSSAVPNASGVSYLVTFTPATTTTTVKSIAVDFCGNDPLIGDACTAPNSFSVGTPTVTGATVTGQTAGSWTASAANSSRTLLLSNATTTGTPTGAASFTLTTAHNPNSTGTFYARILTFANSGDAATWAAANAGAGSSTNLVVDAGGIALSTASTIVVTAKVQEQLTFCTSSATVTTCGSTSPPLLTLGHDNGSGTTILDNSAVDATEAYTQLSTNAQSGAIVRMKALNTCVNGGMSSDGGTTCAIEGAGTTPGDGTAVTIAAGAPAGNPGGAFGVCINKGANTTVAPTYTDSVNNCPTTGWNATSKYGMGGTSVTSTYGDQIFSTSGAVSAENNAIVFAATATTTTPAAIYTANESLVATGTF